MSDGVHPVARSGFGTSADRYERGRPGYPPEAVRWLVDRLGMGPGTTVADIGAGTGKLTRLLLATGARVIAVEPVPEMAGFLPQTAPDAEVVSATAENLPFADGTIDAITVAQAFHWFDAEAAWAGFRRALRPNGGVGLVWNHRGRNTPWIDEIWSVMDQVEASAPWKGRPPLTTAGVGFGAIERRTFDHVDRVTVSALMDRIASVSHVASLPDRRRRQVLDRVRAAIPVGVEPLIVPYTAECLVTRRT